MFCILLLFTDKIHCLSLYYHMNGRGMGTFEIYTYKTSYERHFSISGNQGRRWHKLDLDLPLDEYTYVSQPNALYHFRFSFNHDLFLVSVFVCSSYSFDRLLCYGIPVVYFYLMEFPSCLFLDHGCCH